MRIYLPGDTLAPASVRRARQSRTTVVLQPWAYGMLRYEAAGASAIVIDPMVAKFDDHEIMISGPLSRRRRRRLRGKAKGERYAIARREAA